MTKSRWFTEELQRRGVSRREFNLFCASIAGVLSLPRSAGAEIARTLESTRKPIVVWLEFQDCTGCTESFLRASRPTVADIVLDVLSVDYHETIMAAAGKQAEELREKTVKENPGKYIAVVEGSIPENGAFCAIGGRAALDIAREVCGSAMANLAVGTCASFGGLPEANPNPSGAMSLAQAVPQAKNLVNLSGCPVNGENVVASVTYFLTYGRFPQLDSLRRPRFAYGKTIHDNCERRAHFDSGQFVKAWGDEGHRTGYCLYEMGCKGPVGFHNCPVVRWNEGTAWPVGCGHPCIGCSEPQFWDKMTPFYQHVSGVPTVVAAFGLDTVGTVLGIGAAGGVAAHGVARYTRRHLLTKLGTPKKQEPPATPGKDEEAPR